MKTILPPSFVAQLGGSETLVVLTLAAWLIGIVMAVIWFFFPFVVYGKMDRLIKAAARHTELLEKIERNTRPPSAEKTTVASSAAYRIPGL